MKKSVNIYKFNSRESVMVIPTRLRAARSDDLIPAGARDFSRLQNSSQALGVLPATCSMGTRTLYPVGKAAGT